MAHLPDLKLVEKLCFSGCAGFEGTGFAALGERRLPRLQTLILNDTCLSDAGLQELSLQLWSMVELRRLYLRQCQAIGSSGFCALARRLPHRLEELHLSQTSLDDIGLASISHALPELYYLRKVDLHGCENITEAGLASVINILPQFQEMIAVEEDFMCEEGHPLFLLQPIDDTFHYCRKCRCLQPQLSYACRLCERLYEVCDFCASGALLLPRRLELTQAGGAFKEAWQNDGRELQQLRWL